MSGDFKEKFSLWMSGGLDPMEHVIDAAEVHDTPRLERKKTVRAAEMRVLKTSKAQKVITAEQKGFYKVYTVVAVISCLMLIGVLLFTVANLPRYGEENPRAAEVYARYVEEGVQETGAVNIVSGMILDYRAFDTLGESHVLFTALLCVLILLRKDRKTTEMAANGLYAIGTDEYRDISKDLIMRIVGAFLLPSIFMYGIYILLNGQNSPGGGFSGGAVIGAGFIIFATAYGFDKVDRFFTLGIFKTVIFASLAFYSFAKGYVFFTGANGLDNHIPKGTPGAILSGGMILPLDIAVGMVVACTMYGFYSLFKRGNIGSD